MTEKEKGIKVTRSTKAQIQQIVEIAEGCWLDTWPGTIEEEVEAQMDTVEGYEMMNRICEKERVKELNL